LLTWQPNRRGAAMSADGDFLNASDDEIRNLCQRLLARANSVVLKDQPEQQRDLRFAAQLLLQQINRDEP
jgi:hypothetical protein